MQDQQEHLKFWSRSKILRRDMNRYDEIDLGPKIIGRCQNINDMKILKFTSFHEMKGEATQNISIMNIN